MGVVVVGRMDGHEIGQKEGRDEKDGMLIYGHGREEEPRDVLRFAGIEDTGAEEVFQSVPHRSHIQAQIELESMAGGLSICLI